jgi:hypothetical protein
LLDGLEQLLEGHPRDSSVLLLLRTTSVRVHVHRLRSDRAPIGESVSVYLEPVGEALGQVALDVRDVDARVGSRVVAADAQMAVWERERERSQRHWLIVCTSARNEEVALRTTSCQC